MVRYCWILYWSVLQHSFTWLGSHVCLLKSFRVNLIKIIRPIPNSVFDIFNPLGLKLITRLQLGLSHLNEYRFNHHNFNDCINPLCTCSLDIESTVHYFLHCNYYNSARISLLNDLNSVDRTLLNLSDLSSVNVLLYGGVLSLMTLKMHIFWIQVLKIY